MTTNSVNNGGHHHGRAGFVFSRNSAAVAVAGPALEQIPATGTESHFGKTMAASNTNGEVMDDDIDKIMAMELNQLSLKDREDICNEIHGVHSLAVPETPDFVAQKLEEMDRLLTTHHSSATALMTLLHHQSPTGCCNAYEDALRLGSPYIQDPNFRIMFLRADLFDASKAASRMMNFLELLRDYFGTDALMRLPYASLNDLTANEIQLLKKGVIQVLPGRDSAGRRICGYFVDPGDSLLHLVS
jgi:hypothetical protein